MMLHYIFIAIMVYYTCLNAIYALLIALGATQLRSYRLGIKFGEFKHIAESSQTLPFTIVIPAYNEEMSILTSTLAALNLRYPRHEVIVVNDGSTDRTLEALSRYFSLRRAQRVSHTLLKTQAVKAIYQSLSHPNLLVVDKVNGRRGDAINAGVNYARHPMICMLDADSVLETDALLHVVRPFLADASVIAAGGMVRPSNGLTIEDGRITGYGLPRNTLSLMQSVEYLRSFLWSRLGLARLHCLLCISGAFTVVKKQVFVAVGGCNAQTITDDIELTIRLNRYVHQHLPGNPTRPKICFVPEAVCYTEVPESGAAFASQRNRWQRGTLQALFMHWRMAFNPRFGITGLVGMPYYFVFEAFSALVEGLSYALIPVMLWSGAATLSQLLLFFLLAIALGSLLSVSAVLLQEFTRHKVEKTSDLVRLMVAGLLENISYHQVHLLWRLVGSFEYLVRRRQDLGFSERYGSLAGK